MTIAVEQDVFARRAERATELAARYPYAAEPLRLFGALATAHARIFERARADRPSFDDLPAYVVANAVPGVMEAAMTAGTELLREAVLLRFHEGDLSGIVSAYLADGELSDADRFIARAAVAPILEACPDLGASLRSVDDERRCPACGGLPQLAVFTDTGESLVTGQRRLVCSRCATEWQYARMTCVSCRETEGAKMPVLADEGQIGHLRVDACDTCRAYLVTVDLRKEPNAVPLVDEIAALPLDMLAADHGYTKISPNVMGF